MQKTKPLRLYLAGPMSNIPQHNFPAFLEAADALRDAGFDIISPAEIDKPSTRKLALSSKDGSIERLDQTWGDLLSRDIKIVADEVDGVIVIDGWQKSMGARLETYCAYVRDKPVYNYNHFKSRKALVKIPKEHLYKAWLNGGRDERS
jgi:hypothetical protein